LARRYIPAHLKRYRQITEVLVRHGFGSLVGVFGLERFVPFARGVHGSPHRSSSLRTPEHLRKALEELGATFIKLGQILSTRADLLPSAYQVELARLQDQVAPLAGDVIEEVLQTALGRPLHEMFASFDHEPLAAASIGQAHAATLHGGEDISLEGRAKRQRRSFMLTGHDHSSVIGSCHMIAERQVYVDVE
jgi:ubiquinone biosynthesis protein